VRAFRIGLAAIVVVVWIVGYYRAYRFNAPEPTGLNLLMAPVLAWAFGGEVIERVRKRKPDTDG
jgi:hypothetical protein